MSHHDTEPARDYKQIVEEIKNLAWEKLSAKELQELMYLGAVAAVEFAEALRVALTLYPKDSNLLAMAAGELETDNLVLEDYSARADHLEFLKHFLKKYNLEQAVSPETVIAGATYISECRKLSAETRAMSVFSREEELSNIFNKILQAPDWDAPGLEAYKYFLERHIHIDTDEGGHHDMVKKFPIDNSIAQFYSARLDLYKSIPTLFEK